jgi:hypothetical protein
MKKISLVLLLGEMLLVAAAPLSAQTCPAVGSSTNCGIDITINSNGSLTITPVAGIQPIDTLLHPGAGDDVLVGVINNSAFTIASITLTGTGSPNNAFGFDGDGLCSGYTTTNGPAPSPSGCLFDLSGYGGPITFFSNENSNFSTGTVNFGGGLGPGKQTYFSLEAAPTTGTSAVLTPEPGSLILMGTGLAGLVIRGRRSVRT